ncbi:MAG: hypothetical protein MRECE_42c020 [Mycoplasmataceae bacterium CE_OT135]|nr:MAG: hypothetical protein MRECE_42c020 [Mycoplasmataceae bacterium CE_OT135]
MVFIFICHIDKNEKATKKLLIIKKIRTYENGEWKNWKVEYFCGKCQKK